jgi:hypothetical protein
MNRAERTSLKAREESRRGRHVDPAAAWRDLQAAADRAERLPRGRRNEPAARAAEQRAKLERRSSRTESHA